MKFKNKITGKIIEWDCVGINSAILSAQSRKRLYWTNIGNIEQPKDRHIYLQDIIESVDPDSIKSYCIDASYFKGGNLKQYFEKSRRQIVFDSPIQVAHIDENRHGRRVYDTNGKSTTILGTGGNLGGRTGLYVTPVTYNQKSGVGKVINKSLTLESSNWRGLNRNQNQTAIVTGAAERVRYDEHKDSFIKTELRDDNKSNAVIAGNRRKYLAAIYPARIVGRRVNEDGKRDDSNRELEIKQFVELKTDGKTNNLSTVSKDSVVVESLQEIGSTDRVSLQKRIAELIESGDLVIRMLTPVECERLQTVKDDYTKYGDFNGKVKEISKTQRYKMLGNGWTIDVIAHIFSFIPQIKSGEWTK